MKLKLIAITMFALTAVVRTIAVGVAQAEDIHFVRMQYTDEFDLGRKTQAFIAECDTTLQKQVWSYDFHYDTVCSFIFKGDTANVMIPISKADSTLGELLYPETRIRCRRLVGVTAVSEPEIGAGYIKPFGQAIIWYREKEE